MVQKKMIKSTWPYHSKEEINQAIKVLKSGKTNYWVGNICETFEYKFSKYIGVKYGITIANGSLALDAAIEALEFNYDDEILVTPRSYMSSASCIIRSGQKAKFVDVDLNSQNIDPKKIEKAINKNTKAIICVHLSGYPCDMKSIKFIAKKYNLKIIEDCSQAHGAKINNKVVGSFGDISTWSFCNDKIMSTGGEGGFIATNNKKLWKKIWSIKDIGKDYDSVFNKKHKEGFKWFHDHIGTNMRMTEMQAAIGLVQLSKLDKMIKIRNNNVKKIWKVASNFNCFRIPFVPSEIKLAAYRCYIFLNLNELKKGWSRSRIVLILNSFGINCKSGSCPEIYKEKAFKKIGYNDLKLKNAQKLGKESIAFEVHPNLTSKEVQYICDKLEIVGSNCSK